MTTKQNLLQIIDYKHLTKSEFCKKTGLSNGFFTNDGAIGSNKIHNIVKVYPDISLEWLITGQGSMLKKDVTPSTPVSDNSTKGIPLIPLDAMAGFGTGEMQIMDYNTDRYIVPEFDELNVDFMIRVKGSSMYPKYNSGDTVACRKLPLDTFFQWNKVYVLDTIQGPMIKRIHKSTIDNSILCISDNNKYQPFDLQLKEVYSLAIVVGVIRLE